MACNRHHLESDRLVEGEACHVVLKDFGGNVIAETGRKPDQRFADSLTTEIRMDGLSYQERVRIGTKENEADSLAVNTGDVKLWRRSHPPELLDDSNLPGESGHAVAD